jgi:hypothetical protein
MRLDADALQDAIIAAGRRGSSYRLRLTPGSWRLAVVTSAFEIVADQRLRYPPRKVSASTWAPIHTSYRRASDLQLRESQKEDLPAQIAHNAPRLTVPTGRPASLLHSESAAVFDRIGWPLCLGFCNVSWMAFYG